MDIGKLFQKINDAITAAGKEQAAFSSKLEAHRRDKEQAEAAKAAALKAKDEQGYKAACRALADAEAGIEFNSICLRSAESEKHATDQENAEIMRDLRKAGADVFVPTMLAIEKALDTAVTAANEALQKYSAIDDMARAWKQAVMSDHNERSLSIDISKEYSLPVAQLAGKLKQHLTLIRMGKEKNPLFNGGKDKNESQT